MHVIRLRGPWNCEPLEGSPPGAIRWSRHFHKPTGIGSLTKVWLVADPLPGPALVRLNGVELGAVAGKYEITQGLLARNKIVIELVCPPDNVASATLDGVRLEIEDG